MDTDTLFTHPSISIRNTLLPLTLTENSPSFPSKQEKAPSIVGAENSVISLQAKSGSIAFLTIAIAEKDYPVSQAVRKPQGK